MYLDNRFFSLTGVKYRTLLPQTFRVSSYFRISKISCFDTDFKVGHNSLYHPCPLEVPYRGGSSLVGR